MTSHPVLPGIAVIGPVTTGPMAAAVAFTRSFLSIDLAVDFAALSAALVLVLNENERSKTIVLPISASEKRAYESII